MDSQKEIRSLSLVVPEPEPNRLTTEVRIVTMEVVFSDGTRTNLKAGSSMNPWPSDDLLNAIKGYIAALEQAS
jgi:hypothetical protein